MKFGSPPPLKIQVSLLAILIAISSAIIASFGPGLVFDLRDALFEASLATADRGDATLDAWYPRWQDAADQVLRERGWTDPWAVSVAVPGADHSEAAWAARLDQPLRLLFAPWPDAAP